MEPPRAGQRVVGILLLLSPVAPIRALASGFRLPRAPVLSQSWRGSGSTASDTSRGKPSQRLVPGAEEWDCFWAMQKQLPAAAPPLWPPEPEQARATASRPWRTARAGVPPTAFLPSTWRWRTDQRASANAWRTPSPASLRKWIPPREIAHNDHPPDAESRDGPGCRSAPAPRQASPHGRHGQRVAAATADTVARPEVRAMKKAIRRGTAASVTRGRSMPLASICVPTTSASPSANRSNRRRCPSRPPVVSRSNRIRRRSSARLPTAPSPAASRPKGLERQERKRAGRRDWLTVVTPMTAQPLLVRPAAMDGEGVAVGTHHHLPPPRS